MNESTPSAAEKQHVYDEEGQCEACGQTRECHPSIVKSVSHSGQAVDASAAGKQWKMSQPKVGDKVLRFLTPCCNYEFLADDCPVTWNEFNKVVQCHNCGQIYEPCRHSVQAVDRQKWKAKRYQQVKGTQ